MFKPGGISPRMASVPDDDIFKKVSPTAEFQGTTWAKQALKPVSSGKDMLKSRGG